MKLGIIGVGKMGGAILNGISNSNVFKKEDILLAVHSDLNKDKLAQEGFFVTTDVKEIFKNADVILIAIKPQGFKTSLIEAKEFDFKNKIVISIAAGIKIKAIKEYFKNAAVVRAMPNTPALIGRCVATLASNEEIDEIVLKIFSSVGVYEVIKEEDMDSTLPLNGSMPAYLYYFAKLFIDTANADGIDYDVAKELVVNSIIASGEMILNSKASIDELINNVCSKGGTTLKGLEALDDRFKNSIEDCYYQCKKRSLELSND